VCIGTYRIEELHFREQLVMQSGSWTIVANFCRGVAPARLRTQCKDGS